MKEIHLKKTEGWSKSRTTTIIKSSAGMIGLRPQRVMAPPVARFLYLIDQPSTITIISILCPRIKGFFILTRTPFKPHRHLKRLT